MRLKVKVIPNARKRLVMEQPDGSLKVKVIAVAEKGKANKELIEVLADHFDVKVSAVKIMTGYHDRQKIVEITLP